MTNLRIYHPFEWHLRVLSLLGAPHLAVRLMPMLPPGYRDLYRAAIKNVPDPADVSPWY